MGVSINKGTGAAIPPAIPLEDLPFDTSRQPLCNVRWVPVEQIVCNSYNPNVVAKKELNLLQISVLKDDYTQPVVTVYDPDNDRYVIIDGFHRYTIMKINKEIRDRTAGYLPIVVLNKSLADRMEATVRHNRARGSHNVDGMSSLVFSLLKEGVPDEEICNRLGMEAVELDKLKHVSGFAKLFEDTEHSPEWKYQKMIELEEEFGVEG